MRRIRTISRWRRLSVLMVIALIAAACGGGGGTDTTETTAASDEESPTTEATDDPGDDGGTDSSEPIVVGHLTAHTGPFADVGPLLDGATAFPIEHINENPPLGREFVQVNQDLGTIGEAQASRLLMEREDTDILWGIAHEYLSYRDYLLGFIADNGVPLVPSVHGGAVPAEYGGTSEEPLFRGAPMDTSQAVAAVVQADELGAESVAILATEIEGSQSQKEAAIAAAEELGLEVSIALDVQPEQTSYRSAVSALVDAEPDTALMFTQAEDGATIVKQAAEAGLSLTIIGTQEWLGLAFPEVATMSAIEQHEAVLMAAYSHADSPAWDFYESEWESSEFAELAGAENSYAMQFYDLLNVTALAIEAAGELDAASWADAMYEVSMAPGTTVYTYEEGIEALRNGEDIDYSGVTGEYDYTETGVVSGLYGIFEWVSEDDFERVNVIDDVTVLELDPFAAGE